MGRTSEAKTQLIAVATEMIYLSSYEAVSVDDLCAAARVGKSSFYHFFASKQDLALASIENNWEQLEELVLKPCFAANVPPQERIVRFFDLIWQRQQMRKQASGHVGGCPFGNLAVELSTQNEPIRARVALVFQKWTGYFASALRDAQAQGLVPATLDIPTTAQALLAYIEGVQLLAKSNNDPELMRSMRDGVLAIMQYKAEPQAA